jgi:galactokinase
MSEKLKFQAFFFLLHDVLEIVPPEIDIMVTEARKISGILGSRMTGCGFGGSTISLIKEESIHTFVEQMSEIYEFETDVKNSFLESKHWR